MHFNHIDLGVTDVIAAATFFERHFDFTVDQIMVNDSRAILEGATGEIMVLTHQPTPVTYPKNFHIGFLVDDDQSVHDKHAELTAAGIDRLSPIRELRGGVIFYCTVPGGILVEVGHRPRTNP
jgi:catechol 2,3-dioxygenase-like lactoylglutathione lyase family enzyme